MGLCLYKSNMICDSTSKRKNKQNNSVWSVKWRGGVYLHTCNSLGRSAPETLNIQLRLKAEVNARIFKCQALQNAFNKTTELYVAIHY